MINDVLGDEDEPSKIRQEMSHKMRKLSFHTHVL